MNMQTPYSPIDCEFHDLLEDLATLRQRTSVRFRDESGASHLCEAAIVDVFARGGAEYATLSTGETLRLDQLIEVGGKHLAHHGEGVACAL